MADQVDTITGSCHCGSSRYSFKVPSSLLPIPQLLCHSNISRRTSGCLFTSYIEIPLSNAKPDLSSLTSYESSDILTIWFCSTCSTHMYLEYNHDGHFEVSYGTLEKSDGVIEFVGHMWIEDTKDGGASRFMPEFGGKLAQRWLAAPNKSPEIPLGWTGVKTTASTQESSKIEEKLHAHCHCGGVDFYISRPNEESLKASSPFPDLLVPYNSRRSAANPENKPWWLSTDRTKYLSGTCACNSCRRIAGFDIVSWAFVPVTSLSLADDEPFRRGFGTLKSYTSSPRRTRWFCGTCGANVFWDGDERPTLLDISVGLLDAKSGTRAEEWLEWETGRVSFREDFHNEGLVVDLERGLKRWKDGLIERA
jgi:hypothetical protein